MPKIVTKEEFVEKMNLLHSFTYNYDKTIYINNSTNIVITCAIHGDFQQLPSNHSRGTKCPVCAGIQKGKAYSEFWAKTRNWDFEQPNDYKLIPLNKNKFTKVDNEDFEKLKNINWRYSRGGYATSEKLGFLHRFITDCPDGKVIDHIDHDPLNNRKSNLRICTPQQNAMNQSVQKRKKSSKYKGVFFNNTYNYWTASIKYNQCNYLLGNFLEEEEVALAYNKKALELFGEFACLNKI